MAMLSNNPSGLLCSFGEAELFGEFVVDNGSGMNCGDDLTPRCVSTVRDFAITAGDASGVAFFELLGEFRTSGTSAVFDSSPRSAGVAAWSVSWASGNGSGLSDGAPSSGLLDGSAVGEGGRAEAVCGASSAAGVVSETTAASMAGVTLLSGDVSNSCAASFGERGSGVAGLEASAFSGCASAALSVSACAVSFGVVGIEVWGGPSGFGVSAFSCCASTAASVGAAATEGSRAVESIAGVRGALACREASASSSSGLGVGDAAGASDVVSTSPTFGVCAGATSSPPFSSFGGVPVAAPTLSLCSSAFSSPGGVSAFWLRDGLPPGSASFPQTAVSVSPRCEEVRPSALSSGVISFVFSFPFPFPFPDFLPLDGSLSRVLVAPSAGTAVASRRGSCNSSGRRATSGTICSVATGVFSSGAAAAGAEEGGLESGGGERTRSERADMTDISSSGYMSGSSSSARLPRSL
ncbi:hypothetical protein C8R45DRAFT_336855 [Mycena sanguinolenta]|nr:hypothetical protein C8R45DRAFT_336855 [Mycena sanguinolenta]